MSDCCIIYKKIKYIKLHDENFLKLKSFEDNIYFTISDIWLNINDIDHCSLAEYFNDKLTDNIIYENRDDSFRYSNTLSNTKYVKQLYNWLKYINKSDFCFHKIDKNSSINLKNYVLFNEWWQNLKNIRSLLKNY